MFKTTEKDEISLTKLAKKMNHDQLSYLIYAWMKAHDCNRMQETNHVNNNYFSIDAVLYNEKRHDEELDPIANLCEEIYNDIFRRPSQTK